MTWFGRPRGKRGLWRGGGRLGLLHGRLDRKEASIKLLLRVLVVVRLHHHLGNFVRGLLLLLHLDRGHLLLGGDRLRRLPLGGNKSSETGTCCRFRPWLGGWQNLLLLDFFHHLHLLVLVHPAVIFNLAQLHELGVHIFHLDINHLPEPSEVHGGGLLIPLAELAVVHQARKLMESLGHDESALTDRRANCTLYLFINEMRIGTQLFVPLVANLGDPLSLGDQQLPEIRNRAMLHMRLLLPDLLLLLHCHLFLVLLIQLLYHILAPILAQLWHLVPHDHHLVPHNPLLRGEVFFSDLLLRLALLLQPAKRGLDSRSSKRSESGAGFFPSLWVNLIDDFLLLLRPRDLVTALRGDEMTMDSAVSFLLEGVLKLVGAPNRFS